MKPQNFENNQEQKKFYFFAYDLIEYPEFFNKMFGSNVINKKATLNGFVKCISNDQHYLFIKKDKQGSLKGTLFEISKDQLFLVDRFYNLPLYERFLANVLSNDDNQIIENVYVYTNIQIENYKIINDDFKPSSDYVEKKYTWFKEILEESRNLETIYDYTFVYKCNHDEMSQLQSLNSTVSLIEIGVTMNNGTQSNILLIGAINHFVKDTQAYITLSIFNHRQNMNPLFYKDIFMKPSNLSILKEVKLSFVDCSTGKQIEFFNKHKPSVLLSMEYDKRFIKTDGWWTKEKEMMGIKTPEFHEHHWTRYDALLNFFFDYKDK
ncbi:hypothetical protein OF363_01930 [Mycoplasma enhydrae]|uniref:hypothetical protein n=1 Tax=Mycoplasma enhydrae TaxID=2499220 RepID=UPI0021E87AAF|nr:hypothetical protein [Mycoplasma enhydrae]MCV3733792.1 hypothetical protein [Mycoplasma enhydrae]